MNMKTKISIILILMAMSLMSMSQEKNNGRKLYLSAEIGNKYFHEFTVGQRTFKGYSQMVATTPIELSMYLCHDFNSKNSLSLGLSIYDAFLQGNKLTPVIVDYRYFFSEKSNTLFANAGVGYTFFGPSDIKSAVFKLGLGYRFEICCNKRMHIAVNYDLNKLYEVVAFDSNSSWSSSLEDVDVYAFNVKIGIGF